MTAEQVDARRAAEPISEDEVVYEVSQLPIYYRVRGLRGQWQVKAYHPPTGFTGSAVQSTEDQAKNKALLRLLHARDMNLSGYRIAPTS